MKNIVFSAIIMMVMCSCTSKAILYHSEQIDSIRTMEESSYGYFSFDNVESIPKPFKDGEYNWMFYDDPDAYDYENLMDIYHTYHPEWNDGHIILLIHSEEYEYYIKDLYEYLEAKNSGNYEELEDFDEAWEIKEFIINGGKDIMFVLQLII